jgi:hypothetical protein
MRRVLRGRGRTRFEVVGEAPTATRRWRSAPRWPDEWDVLPAHGGHGGIAVLGEAAGSGAPRVRPFVVSAFRLAQAPAQWAAENAVTRRRDKGRARSLLRAMDAIDCSCTGYEQSSEVWRRGRRSVALRRHAPRRRSAASPSALEDRVLSAPALSSRRISGSVGVEDEAAGWAAGFGPRASRGDRRRRGRGHGRCGWRTSTRPSDGRGRTTSRSYIDLWLPCRARAPWRGDGRSSRSGVTHGRTSCRHRRRRQPLRSLAGSRRSRSCVLWTIGTTPGER